MYKYLTQADINRIKDEIVNIFEQRFGHLDFWRLSKRWKRIHYEREADIMIQIIEMEIQRKVEDNAN